MKLALTCTYCRRTAMIDVARALPEDPDELRAFTQLLLAEVKSQAMLIESKRLVWLPCLRPQMSDSVHDR